MLLYQKITMLNLENSSFFHIFVTRVIIRYIFITISHHYFCHYTYIYFIFLKLSWFFPPTFHLPYTPPRAPPTPLHDHIVIFKYALSFALQLHFYFWSPPSKVHLTLSYFQFLPNLIFWFFLMSFFFHRLLSSYIDFMILWPKIDWFILLVKNFWYYFEINANVF